MRLAQRKVQTEKKREQRWSLSVLVKVEEEDAAKEVEKEPSVK